MAMAYITSKQPHILQSETSKLCRDYYEDLLDNKGGYLYGKV